MTAHRTVLLISTALLALMAVNGASAQKKDTVRSAADTVKNRFLPTGIRIGTDVISLVKTRAQEDFHGWEVSGEMDFSRYFLAIDVGTWGRDFRSDSATYRNTGDYWRAGVDVNFLPYDPDRNVFFLGMRYGRSLFREYMRVERYDPIWGSFSGDFYHENVKVSWLELTTGLRVKIWKVFWVGYTARFKFGVGAAGTPEMLSHDVPGFGKTNKETSWGFNYYLMMRIPLRKAPPVPVKLKK